MRYPDSPAAEYPVSLRGTLLTEVKGRPKQSTGHTSLFSLNPGKIRVRFETEDKNLKPGSELKVVIEWPVLRDGNKPLDLILWGRVADVRPSHVNINVDRRALKVRNGRGRL